MRICSFFGHHDYSYCNQQENLTKIIVDLIENYGVTDFYCGFRGNFDELCSTIISKLKLNYKNIKLSMVLSYHPSKKEDNFQPLYIDDSVYLLNRYVPPALAIIETNKMMVDCSDFIVCGVKYTFGGANTAIEYAERKKKNIVYLFEERKNRK